MSKILPNFLFRVDILLTVVPDGHIKYLLSSIREVTDLPVIFITDSNYYNEKDFDYIYRLYKQTAEFLDVKNYEEQFLNLSRITDIKNDWDMSLGDLRTQYIRDKKINDISPTSLGIEDPQLIKQISNLSELENEYNLRQIDSKTNSSLGVARFPIFIRNSS
jgi:hypothetical protein